MESKYTTQVFHRIFINDFFEFTHLLGRGGGIKKGGFRPPFFIVLAYD